MKSKILWIILIILTLSSTLLTIYYIKETKSKKIEFGFDLDNTKSIIKLKSYKKETRNINQDIIESIEYKDYTLQIDNEKISICSTPTNTCEKYNYEKSNKLYILEKKENLDEEYFLTIFDAYDEEYGTIIEYVKQLNKQGDYSTIYFK